MPSGVTEVQTRKESPMGDSRSSGHGGHEPPPPEPSKDENMPESSRSHQDEEGVEVVLGDERGSAKVVEGSSRPRHTNDQNVFRHPQAVRPRAMRAHNGPPPPQPYLHGSGSWGYGPPPAHGEYPPPPPRPYPVPTYNSGSWEEQGSFHHTPHYSPHIQYPPPGGRYPSEEVNVISPNHKTDSQYRPPITPRSRHMPPPQQYYQYPPTSPVSRPGGSQGRSSGPPRLRNYAVRRAAEGPYSKVQRGEQSHPDDGTWNAYPPPPPPSSENADRAQPQLVNESSFDSEHHSRGSQSNASHPPTPRSQYAPPPPPPPSSHDPHYQFYGGGGSWGSFDSAAGPPPPPQFDDQRYYGFPPDSPYSPYAAPFSPGGLYQTDSFPPPPGYGPMPPYSFSYDEEERHLLKDYHPDRDGQTTAKEVTPQSKSKSRGKSSTPITSNASGNNMLLPKAAEEVDFDVTDPPTEPVTPPSEEPVCDSLADVNSYDVLCGRGGGTNSQIGNRRFRKLVQDFQPTYLLARRKEKPLLARTIVLIIRKRGGRFLKKDEDTGELYEVGDAKAEAKTSQALREGLDVRATKSAASTLLVKTKKKSGKSGKDDSSEDLDSPKSAKDNKEGKSNKDANRAPESPPTLPRLADEGVKAGVVHPHSPEQMEFRKRRRMRPVAPQNDKFFPDFCPPRADIGRCASPEATEGCGFHLSTTPIRRSASHDDDSIRYENESVPQPRGCAGIALDMVTGAATGSFCLGPTGWRR